MSADQAPAHPLVNREHPGEGPAEGESFNPHAETARGNEGACLMPWVKDRKGERFIPPPKPEVPHTQAVKQWGRRMLVDMYKLYDACPHKACRRKRACSMAACWEETRLIFAEKIIPQLREASEAEQGRKPPEPYDPDAADVARDRRHWAAGDAVKTPQRTRRAEGEKVERPRSP